MASEQYHKIETVFKRDPATKFRTLLMGQYATPEFAYLADNEWEFTEKVDGTNIRVSVDKGRMVIQGRTDNASIPTFLLTSIVFTEIITAERILSLFDGPLGDFCLYGEGYGAKIQKGGCNYKSDGVSFVLFDVKVDGWWLKREDVEGIAAKLGIATVPFIGEGNLTSMVHLAENGFNSCWGDFAAEGIVARPKIELKARSGKRIITKIKTRDFA